MDKSNGKSYMEAVRPRAATTSLPITRAFECATERDRHSRSRSSEPASGRRPPRKQSHRRGRPCSTGQLRRRARSLPRRSPGFSLPRTDRNRLLHSLRLCVFFPTFRYQILPSSCSARKRSGEEPGAARPRRSVERGPRLLHKDDRPSRSPASHVCRTRSSLCRLAAFQRWRRGAALTRYPLVRTEKSTSAGRREGVPIRHSAGKPSVAITRCRHCGQANAGNEGCRRSADSFVATRAGSVSSGCSDEIDDVTCDPPARECLPCWRLAAGHWSAAAPVRSAPMSFRSSGPSASR
jgi:hypothetical protein